jgi:hypothetical protein
VFLEIIYPIITLVVGAILGAWATVFVARPKLKVSGSSSGGGARLRVATLRITNSPGMMGLALGPTIILGKRISRGFQKGITIERTTANECTAYLYDKVTNEPVAPLYWRPVAPDSKTTILIDIKSGQQIDLLLFARVDDELKFFAYKPDGPSGEPLEPQDELKFTESRRFIVRITYSYGRQKMKTDVGVRKGFDGLMYFQHEHGGGSF